MDEKTENTPSLEVSKLSKTHLMQKQHELDENRRNSTERDYAMKTAKMILSRYPDYAKATPEYTAGIVEILSRHPRYIQNRLADVQEGIIAHCAYMPTIADIQKLVAKWEGIKPAPTTYKKLIPNEFPEGYDNNTESRKAFIESLNLDKQFPHGSHRREKPQRVKWDGPATEAALQPGGKSKYATGEPFPDYLMESDMDT